MLSTSAECRGERDAFLRLMASLEEAAITTRIFAIYMEVRARPGRTEGETVWMLDWERRISKLHCLHLFLIRLAADGYSQAQIAEIYGCSLRTMVRLCRDYGVQSMVGRAGRRLGRPPRIS